MSYRIGDIVHVLDPFARGYTKNKFMVIIGIDPHQFLAVNTADYGNYDSIPLKKKSGIDFPRHDSFIACKNIHLPEISQITGKVGQLDDEDLLALKVKISVSLHFTGYQQERFAAGIDAEFALRAR